MNEEEVDRTPFNGEELDRAFNRLAGAGACPMCGTESWVVMQNKRGSVAVVPWATPEGGLYMSGLPVLSLNCTRCGFIRQHAIKEFKKFMEEQDGN